jgi:hypothetical protein
MMRIDLVFQLGRRGSSSNCGSSRAKTPGPRASYRRRGPAAPDDQFIDVPRAVPADDVAERVVRLVIQAVQLAHLRSLIVFAAHRRPWARPRQSVILFCLYFGRAAADKRLQPVE